MQGDLCKLTSDWNTIENIVLYGAGTVSKICERLFDKVNIIITCVIDQDKKKQGKEWNGIPIVSFEDAQAQGKIKGKKIVVMAAHAAYNDISSFLNTQGFVEFRDYCRIGEFICEWFWYARGMNCVYHVDMTVTTKCTFNCMNCNMFIPYYNDHTNIPFEDLKHNIDLLFNRIDYVAYFGLIGGEPILHPQLNDIIVYLVENYQDKFGKVSYATNGSVLPSKELLTTMQKYDIHIVISDYSKAISYRNQINKVEEMLKSYNINYDIKPSLIWCDFGFPEHPFKRSEQQLKEHLKYCRPEWNGLNDGKFYYCNISWSAEKSGLYTLKPADYIVLENIDPSDRKACHGIVKLSRGTSSFCQICGGCGRDNENYVAVGVQKPGSNM